jgi:UDP-N-acetylmuramoyl-tripeptide--D-alanyl-D-alanine ligase
MHATPLSKIAQWAGGRLLAGAAEPLIVNVCIDSRALQPGDLFVAIRGENFDGHAFVEEAARRGAAAAMVERAPAGLPENFGVIEVADTVLGLQALSAGYRATLTLKIAGITGSNGKTSTKDFTAAILAQRLRTAKTQGNLNNHLGVPLTLLRLSPEDEIAVVEMGMNHPGEIAPLAALAKPDLAILTNIGTAHIEFMGTREAVAREKSALAEAVSSEGTVILNADDDFTPSIARACRARVVTAGLAAGDVRGTELQPLISGTSFRLHAAGESVAVNLPVPGEHMVRNAVLASAAGLACGLSLAVCARGLAASTLTKGRLQTRALGGITILDDTYNANPDSAIAGLATLMALPGPGRRLAVLGRMAELGQEAERGHRQVGAAAARAGLAALITVGDEAHWIAESAQAAGFAATTHAANLEEAVAALRAQARAGDLVLVKGSRSARMERLIEAWEKGGPL